MAAQFPFETGDVVLMKKKHPCGSSRFKLLRVGADIQMECLGCGHVVLLSRAALNKSVKALEKPQKDA